MEKTFELTNYGTSRDVLQPDVHFDFFSEFAENYISKMIKGDVLTPKKKRFSESTIRQYKVAMDGFREFESLLESKIKVYEVGAKLLQAFELYLCKQNLALNTISLYISKIKAIGNLLFTEEISFRPVKYSTPRELTTKVYLSFSELEKIINCETLTNGQSKAADIFLIQCFTALRYDTLQKFLQNPLAYIKEYEGKSYIDITADKTGEQAVIPLAQIVVQILKKHNFLLPAPTEVYMNKTIKIICEKAGIINMVSTRITKGGSMQETLTPKFKEVSTHTARRTFISLAKQTNMTDREISGITSHNSERQLNEYNRTSNLDKIKGILDHDFFKYKF